MLATKELDTLLAVRLNTRIRPYSTDWVLVEGVVQMLHYHGVWRVTWYRDRLMHRCTLSGDDWSVEASGPDAAQTTCHAILLAIGLPHVQQAARAAIKENTLKL
jgi:hypothetical protein